MKRLKPYFLVAVVFMFFLGCAEKQSELYNKPALFWYKQIIKDIRSSDLENADSHYTSMSSEHVASPLLEEVLLILANAHIEEEEYLLANFYIDEYIKRYGNDKKNEYAKYLKIRANFLSFAYPKRNQKLLLDTIEETKGYKVAYPNSKYLPLVETILVKMQLAKFALNEKIAKLYEKTDRETSAKIYEQRVKTSPLKDAKLIEPTSPWYRSLFE